MPRGGRGPRALEQAPGGTCPSPLSSTHSPSAQAPLRSRPRLLVYAGSVKQLCHLQSASPQRAGRKVPWHTAPRPAYSAFPKKVNTSIPCFACIFLHPHPLTALHHFKKQLCRPAAPAGTCKRAVFSLPAPGLASPSSRQLSSGPPRVNSARHETNRRLD